MSNLKLSILRIGALVSGIVLSAVLFSRDLFNNREEIFIIIIFGTLFLVCSVPLIVFFFRKQGEVSTLGRESYTSISTHTAQTSPSYVKSAILGAFYGFLTLTYGYGTIQQYTSENGCGYANAYALFTFSTIVILSIAVTILFLIQEKKLAKINAALLLAVVVHTFLYPILTFRFACMM